MSLVSKIKAYWPKLHRGVEIINKYSFVTVNKREPVRRWICTLAASGIIKDIWIYPRSWT